MVAWKCYHYCVTMQQVATYHVSLLNQRSAVHAGCREVLPLWRHSATGRNVLQLSQRAHARVPQAVPPGVCKSIRVNMPAALRWPRPPHHLARCQRSGPLSTQSRCSKTCSCGEECRTSHKPRRAQGAACASSEARPRESARPVAAGGGGDAACICAQRTRIPTGLAGLFCCHVAYRCHAN
jgi:hypothetical protein